MRKLSQATKRKNLIKLIDIVVAEASKHLEKSLKESFATKEKDQTTISDISKKSLKHSELS